MFLASAGCGYFVILFCNSYLICKKGDVVMVLLTILPLIVTGFMPNIASIARYFGLKDNIDLDLVHSAMIILDVLVCIIVNSICYRRFYKYKNNDNMNLLLHQYKMGIITIFIMDAILCTIPFIVPDYCVFWYCLISIVSVGLIMEYFLLYRLRNHVMYLIQEANAYN